MMNRQRSDSLDRLLSYRLKRALDDDRRADWLEVRELAGMSRTAWHWSRRRALLVAGVFVLVVGACAGSTGVIPWGSSKPGPRVLPICKAGVVKAKVNSGKEDNPKQRIFGTIFFTNTGKSDCALAGQPKVSLLGGGSDAAHMRILMPANMFSPGRARKPENQTALAQKDSLWGETSSVGFSWFNWCGPHYGTVGHAGKLALRFEIPNGSTLVLPLYRFPGCTWPGGGSTLRFDSSGAWGARLVAPNPPLRAEILGQEKGKHLVVRLGHAFQYRVALTNTSTKPFSFETCPAYRENLLDSENVIAYSRFYQPSIADVPGGPTYYLNCSSAKAMKPGETVVYEMELSVSKRALKKTLKKYSDLAETGLPIPKRALDETTLRNGKLVWKLLRGKHPPTAEAHVKVVP